MKLDAVESTIDLNLGGRFNASGLTNANIVVTSAQAQNIRHILSGTLTGNINYSFPNNGSFYIVTNNCTGAFSVTLLNAGGGAGIVIPQGSTITVFVNPDVPEIENVTSSGSSSPGVTFSLPTSSGTNTITATFSPAVAALTAGTVVTFIAANSITGAATFSPNGLTAKAITKWGAVALQGNEIVANAIVMLGYDGTQWQLLSSIPILTVRWGGTAGGTANALALTPAPAAAALITGMGHVFVAASANTAATPTLAVSGLAAKNITKFGTATVNPGDINANGLTFVVYDGTQFQLISSIEDDGTPKWGGTSAGSATVQTFSLPTTPGAYKTGMVVRWASGFASGAGLTINVNSLGAKTVVGPNGGAIIAGSFALNQILEAVYTGTQFQLTGGNSGVLTVKRNGGGSPFTASGTYTPSAGMLYCFVRLQAPGGGSGGTPSDAGNFSVSGGGGSGGYAERLLTAAQIGASQTVTIGAVGAAGTSGANAGGTGGTTSLGALLSATGGVGGAAGVQSSTTAQSAGG
ncbi:MAG: hypothetical protein ACREQ5_09910, partial [Candidatus Dormibacteria bacterium]